jgi:NADPH:quinone reductase-like Zn-dependent oxidoreductase
MNRQPACFRIGTSSQKEYSMKAIQITQYGNEDQLQIVDIPQPKAAKGQIVVRVATVTFNPIDSKLTSGAMKQIAPLHFPFVPGSDFSGVVDSLGEDVKDFKPGDAVFGYSPASGAYAEFVVVDANKAAKKPSQLSDAEAASLGVVGQTALQMLDRAGLQKGQTVLVQGAGGSVGSIVVQVAHHRGIKVIATATAKDIARLKEYGANQVIDYKAERFEDHVKGVDAVLDAVGGDVQARSFGILKPGGVLVSITQPPSEELARKFHVKASMLLTEPSTESLNKITELVNARVIKAFIGKTYPLSEVKSAWKEIHAGHIDGKVVFQVATDAPRSARASS